MASILKVDTIQDQSGNNIINENADTITIGASGDTITVPTGATFSAPGIANTPNFQVKKTTTQSISSGSFTKLTWNSEDWDTDSAFASDKFTVPSGQDGKYYFQVTTEIGGIDDGEFVQLLLYKNNSSQDGTTARWYSPGSGQDVRARTNAILNLSAADYVEAYIYHNEGGSQNVNTSESFFRGFKLIE